MSQTEGCSSNSSAIQVVQRSLKVVTVKEYVEKVREKKKKNKIIKKKLAKDKQFKVVTKET